MTKDEAIKECYSQHKHSHARWNTWTLFFFGSIVTLITIGNTFDGLIDLSYITLVSFFVSILWILVALSMRRSSCVWIKVIEKIERSTATGFNIQKMYQGEENKFSIKNDFFKTFIDPESAFRVTRVLIMFGVIISLLLGVITVKLFFDKDCIHKTSKITKIEIGNINELSQNLIEKYDSEIRNLNNEISEIHSNTNSINFTFDSLKEDITYIKKLISEIH